MKSTGNCRKVQTAIQITSEQATAGDLLKTGQLAVGGKRSVNSFISCSLFTDHSATIGARRARQNSGGEGNVATKPLLCDWADAVGKKRDRAAKNRVVGVTRLLVLPTKFHS